MGRLHRYLLDLVGEHRREIIIMYHRHSSKDRMGRYLLLLRDCRNDRRHHRLGMGGHRTSIRDLHLRLASTMRCLKDLARLLLVWLLQDLPHHSSKLLQAMVEGTRSAPSARKGSGRTEDSAQKGDFEWMEEGLLELWLQGDGHRRGMG